MPEPTHYQVLSLPKSLLDDAAEAQIPTIIKHAYHRALLRHHPDKTAAAESSASATPTYTIDQITTAYTSLSSPISRAQYDAQLRTQPSPGSAFQATGIETVDLDDLENSPDGTEWYRPCRCGNEKGFNLGEKDLEEAGDLGELIVGCQDCSLWLRVYFAVVEEGEDAQGEAEAAA